MKYVKLLVGLILLVFVFTGCTTVGDADKVIFEAEILKAGDILLVAPEEDSNEFKSSDKISVNLVRAKILDSEGEEITADVLEAGTRVRITYNGMILESYPAQISASKVQVIH